MYGKTKSERRSVSVSLYVKVVWSKFYKRDKPPPPPPNSVFAHWHHLRVCSINYDGHGSYYCTQQMYAFEDYGNVYFTACRFKFLQEVFEHKKFVYSSDKWNPKIYRLDFILTKCALIIIICILYKAWMDKHTKSNKKWFLIAAFWAELCVVPPPQIRSRTEPEFVNV